MTFFDLENKLPRWLDEEIVKHSGFRELKSESVKKLDATAIFNSYHVVCADKGNIVSTDSHQLWKFQNPEGDMRTYGKYLEYSDNRSLKFWIGLVVTNDGLDFYLWFDKLPRIEWRHTVKLTDKKHGYWYQEDPKQNFYKYSICRECGNPVLKEKEVVLKKKTVKAIAYLLDAMM